MLVGKVKLLDFLGVVCLNIQLCCINSRFFCLVFSPCLLMYITGSDFLATIEQTELLDVENLVNFMAHFHMEISFYFPSHFLFLIQLLVRFTEQKHWMYYGKKSNQCSTKGQSFRVLPSGCEPD